MSVATEQEAYLDAVRRALADLDPATRDELLEDLPEHLAEVAAEGECPLVDRLGPPEAYAAEMRAAAGIAEPASTPRGLDDRVASAVRRVRGTLGVADRKAGPVFGYARASEFLRMLLPAWWVLRGYLVAMLITVATTSGIGLLPRLGGSTLAAVLMLVVCVLASIWLGRREASLPPVPKTVVVLAGVLLFVFGVVGFDKADTNGSGYVDFGQPQSVSNNPYEYVQDVYVYDANGNPLTNVSLFDQDGNPIRMGDPYRCGTSYRYQTDVGATAAYPYCPNQSPYQIAPRPGVPVVVAPTPEPTTEPTTEPTAGPTAVPTPESTAEPTGVPTPGPTN
ncbi:hypothetical protein AB0J74_09230 [Asanoa sp. NPDC049573]|uniref:HAAS signaling domain-containing protein n=1 Tax=Asanoa sp. NPDC049573 TaxID=3155396 RepID=UPI00341E66CF